MNIKPKSLLARYGVAVPKGKPAFTVDEAMATAKELGGPVWVVKGRFTQEGVGKGGGVKVVDSLEKVEQTSGEILGMQLVTHQTGSEGKEVKRLYIEEGCDIDRELYLGCW